MRTWPHSGFSVDQSVFLPAGDRPGIERLVQYMTRCPFSLSRLVKVTNLHRRTSARGRYTHIAKFTPRFVGHSAREVHPRSFPQAAIAAGGP